MIVQGASVWYRSTWGARPAGSTKGGGNTKLHLAVDAQSVKNTDSAEQRGCDAGKRGVGDQSLTL